MYIHPVSISRCLFSFHLNVSRETFHHLFPIFRLKYKIQFLYIVERWNIPQNVSRETLKKKRPISCTINNNNNYYLYQQDNLDINFEISNLALIGSTGNK